MPRDQLSGALEDNILTLQVWSEEHAPTVALRVPPELYSTRAYQRIAALSVDYLHKYKRPPRAHLRDLLEEDLNRGDDGRFLSQVLDSMDALHPEIQPEFVLPQLERFIAVRRLTQTINRAADRLHEGDLEAAQEALGEVEIRGNDDRPGVFLHNTDQWLGFLDEDEEEEMFTSGIEVLDDRQVIPRRRSLFLIIGSTGVGKSYWLRQIARDNVLMHRKNVLHITLENDLNETLQHYTMALLGRSTQEVENMRVPVFRRDDLGRFIQLDYAQVTPDRITPAARQRIRRDLRPIQRRPGKLLVKWFPTRTLTVAHLSNYLDMIERTDGFRPDMIVLDYGDLMYTDAKNLRTSLGILFQDLRGLAGQRNLAMVTATQGNRSSSTARVVGANMVAEDWSKIGSADTVCTISRTLDEKEIGLARILVDKSRRSRDKWLALITQAYATGQFCLDSTFFNKLAQDEVKRATGDERDDED